VAAVFLDFPKHKCNFLHKTSLISYGGSNEDSNEESNEAPYEEFFFWGSRHHCRMEVGAYASFLALASCSVTYIISTEYGIS